MGGVMEGQKGRKGKREERRKERRGRTVKREKEGKGEHSSDIVDKLAAGNSCSDFF